MCIRDRAFISSIPARPPPLRCFILILLFMPSDGPVLSSSYLRKSLKKVLLFGSVARGEERIDSDIDLAVEFFGDVRHSRTFVKYFIDRMMGDVLKPLRQKDTNVIGGEKGIWDIINLSTAPKNNLKMFEAKGFFTNSLTMFERAQPELVIDGNTFKLESDDILGWVHMRKLGIYCLLFN